MKQKGFVLYTALAMLVIMSFLAIYMYRSFIQDQKISGNLREKERAVDAATTAMDYIEYWLSQPGNSYTGTWVTGIACSSANQSGTTPVICSNALANPTTLPWSSYNTFTPKGMTVVAAGGQPNSYAANTNIYIQYLGALDSGPSSPAETATYQVTVTAQGGNATAATVVQSVLQVQATSVDVSGG